MKSRSSFLSAIVLLTIYLTGIVSQNAIARPINTVAQPNKIITSDKLAPIPIPPAVVFGLILLVEVFVDGLVEELPIKKEYKKKLKQIRRSVTSGTPAGALKNLFYFVRDELSHYPGASKILNNLRAVLTEWAIPF